MDITNLAIHQANIVLVLDGLNQANVSRDLLRNAITGYTPQYLEIPQIIRLTYTDVEAQLTILFDARRLEAKVSLPNDRAAELLATLAAAGRRSIEHARLVAYGFNFFSTLHLVEDEDARNFLIQQFETSLDPVREQLEGELVSMTTQLNYVRNGQAHQLTLAPNRDGGNSLTVNFNSHFDSGEWPEAIGLAERYAETMGVFRRTVERLFQV